jgi:hypothetical protein
MSNFQEELSTQFKKLRGQVETFVSEKVSPTLDKAATRLKATVDTTSRLDALIALLVSKGIITADELKAAEATQSQGVNRDVPETVPPPTQDQV